MKTTKEKADELVEQYLQLDILVSESEGYLIMRNSDAVQCAILSVKHTLEVLELMKSEYIKRNYICPEIIMSLQEQTELLTELESRL